MTADKVRQLAEQAGIEDATFGLSRFAALVEAATLERAAQECETPVRVLHLPIGPQYDGDVRHIERRVALGAAAAIRALKQKE